MVGERSTTVMFKFAGLFDPLPTPRQCKLAFSAQTRQDLLSKPGYHDGLPEGSKRTQQPGIHSLLFRLTIGGLRGVM